MSIELPLDRMSLEEKLEALEAIWADISRAPEQFPSPEWHRDILAERRELADQGKLKFLDWKTAFQQTKDELRENSDP